MKTSYMLDRDNHIIGVDGAWDDFARENQGYDAMASAVLGKPLWKFVSGEGTRAFLGTLFFASRQNDRPFDTLYRCDSPSERRLCRMHVAPCGAGALLVDHTMLTAEAMAAPPTLFRKGPGARCAMCGAICEGDRWRDPFDAPMREYSYDRQTVCPECRAKAMASLGEAAQAA
jgi:DNA-directed RNA polymerase subunit RPC12/RpoP